MFCGISGKPPKIPVLSPVSKCVFEKELVEQYVQEEGKDPITNDPLSIEQLIEIKLTPQQSSLVNSLNSSTLNSNYSIPNLLSSLQNEWDAIMLENFKLRKQLDMLSKQLSTAFYERDAAKIVAAKALKEREQVVSEINKLTSQLGSMSSNDEDNDTKFLENLPENMIKRLLADSGSYMEQTRKFPDAFIIPKSKIMTLKKSWSVEGGINVHRITNVLTSPHRQSIFLSSNQEKIIIIRGGGTVEELENEINDDIEYVSIGGTSDTILFSSTNGIIGTYNVRERKLSKSKVPHDKIILMAQHEYVLKDHFFSVEETGRIICCSLDCSKTFEVVKSNTGKKVHQAVMHKDGLLIALVQNHAVELYNLSHPHEPPTIFQVGEQIPGKLIERLEFSTNGYWMIVSCSGSVMAFDLRKEVGTLASNPLMLENSTNKTLTWDMDLSAKNILAFESDSGRQQSTLEIARYVYKKAKKSWEMLPESSDKLSIDMVEDDAIEQMQLFYDDRDISLLISSSKHVYLFSMDESSK